jgi:hypothetical protein
MAQSVLIDSAPHPVRPYRTSEHLTKKEASTQDGDFSSASAISYYLQQVLLATSGS